MDSSSVFMWNVLLTVVLGPLLWFLKGLVTDMKVLKELVHKTREDYSTKDDTRDQVRSIMATLTSVEDKLDRALREDKNNG